jgi:hypothetical protein
VLTAGIGNFLASNEATPRFLTLIVRYSVGCYYTETKVTEVNAVSVCVFLLLNVTVYGQESLSIVTALDDDRL